MDFELKFGLRLSDVGWIKNIKLYLLINEMILCFLVYKGCKIKIINLCVV